jgi:DNA-directed RNA polymerase specialized sigma24 family protein
MGVAPKGAFPIALEKPATQQGSPNSHSIDASVVRIERMLRSVFANEAKVGGWERTAKVLKGRRSRIKPPGEDKPRYVDSTAELAMAIVERDSHLDELRHVIDYALTTDAYEDVTCEDCKPWHMSTAPLDFIREVPDAVMPPGSTALCETCIGRGVVRKKRTDPASKVTFKRISYFKKTLESTILSAKVRSKTSEADESYAKLLAKHGALVSKFGNEQQTALEGADAEQGARMGIHDAAMKFDPTRPEGATFGTVAYNWAYRNSRARKPSQERAGVHAKSLDDPGTEDGTPRIDLLSTADEPTCSPTLVLDMRQQIKRLPKMQRKVVQAIYRGDTIASAARAMKMKRVDVQTLCDEAFETLRGALSGYVDVVCD